MRKLLFLPLFLVALSALSQESTKGNKFSLNEAITFALENNYTAINARKDIDASLQKKWETTAMGLPQVNVGVDYQNSFVLQKSLIPAEFFGGNAGEYQAVAFGTKHSVNGQASLSQLIFDGSYIVALQASKTYLKYYQNAKQKTDSEVREMVINAYGNVLLAQESVIILERNKSILEKTLGDTKEIFKNGLIEEENVEQLQITLTSVNSMLNYNKRLTVLALKMLKITIGLDIDSNLELTDKLNDLTTSSLDLAISKENFEVTDNINYKILTNLTEQRELELKLQKSKALPTLSAGLNLGYNAFANQFDFFKANQKWLDYSNLGVSLKIPIFSSFARRARTQQASIALDQAKVQLTETEQKLKLQFANSKSDYELSIEEFATAKSNLNLAERIEKKQQIKFTEGLSSSFDYNDAQRQLYDTQQKYLQSMVDVINKKAALETIINK